jgi:hypothetical protein
LSDISLDAQGVDVVVSGVAIVLEVLFLSTQDVLLSLSLVNMLKSWNDGLAVMSTSRTASESTPSLRTRVVQLEDVRDGVRPGRFLE